MWRRAMAGGLGGAALAVALVCSVLLGAVGVVVATGLGEAYIYNFGYELKDVEWVLLGDLAGSLVGVPRGVGRAAVRGARRGGGAAALLAIPVTVCALPIVIPFWFWLSYLGM